MDVTDITTLTLPGAQFWPKKVIAGLARDSRLQIMAVLVMGTLRIYPVDALRLFFIRHLR
jgi:hypothetical protein